MQLDDEIMEKRLLPCEIMIYDILHLGNRTTERIVKVLFTLGADTISNSMAYYQTSVEAIVNSKEFRFKNNNNSAEETQASNGRRWKFPTGESGETVGEVKMSGREAKNSSTRSISCMKFVSADPRLVIFSLTV